MSLSRECLFIKSDQYGRVQLNTLEIIYEFLKKSLRFTGHHRFHCCSSKTIRRNYFACEHLLNNSDDERCIRLHDQIDRSRGETNLIHSGHVYPRALLHRFSADGCMALQTAA